MTDKVTDRYKAPATQTNPAGADAPKADLSPAGAETPDADLKTEGITQVEIEDTNSRTPRSSESRDDDLRDMPWAPARLLPTPNPVEGLDFRYVRVAYPGSIDNMNHSQALRDRWEPVVATEHPELGAILSDLGTDEGQVRLGGMLLMKRPSWIGERIMQQIAEESMAQIAGVDGSYLNEQNPAMRKFSDKSTRVEFGGGSK